MKNLCAKTRPFENPHEVWIDRMMGIEYRIVKKFQADDNKPYARWNVWVKSPFAGNMWTGPRSAYVSDVKSGSYKVS